MHYHLKLFILFISLVIFSPGALGQSGGLAGSKLNLELRRQAQQTLSQLGGSALKVSWSPAQPTPAQVRGLKLNLPGENDRLRARALLERFPALVAGQSANLIFVEEQQTRSRRIVRFAQRYKGLEVLGAQVIVTLDPAGRILALSSAVAPIQLPSVRPALTPAQAMARVRAQLKRGNLNARAKASQAQLAVLAEGKPRLVYRVRLPLAADAHGRAHLVDAQSGAYLGWQRGAIIDYPLAGKGVRR